MCYYLRLQKNEFDKTSVQLFLVIAIQTFLHAHSLLYRIMKE